MILINIIYSKKPLPASRKNNYIIDHDFARSEMEIKNYIAAIENCTYSKYVCKLDIKKYLSGSYKLERIRGSELNYRISIIETVNWNLLM